MYYNLIPRLFSYPAQFLEIAPGYCLFSRIFIHCSWNGVLTQRHVIAFKHVSKINERISSSMSVTLFIFQKISHFVYFARSFYATKSLRRVIIVYSSVYRHAFLTDRTSRMILNSLTSIFQIVGELQPLHTGGKCLRLSCRFILLSASFLINFFYHEPD